MAVRKSFFFLTGLILAALIAVNSASGDARIIFYRLLILLLLIVVVALVWTSQSLRGIEVQRFARVLRQQVGQVFEERFEILNRSRLGRLWLEIDDLSPIRGKRGSKVVSNIMGRQQRSYFARTLLTERGAFLLGPTVITSGDPFGIFSKSKEIPGEKTLIILPYMVRLNHFPGPAGRLPGGRALRKKSLEVTPYAAGVREYIPGDPLSRIHWRTTARKDKLMVKEFEQDPHADVWIMLDCQRGVHLAEPDTRELEVDELFWDLPRRQDIPLAPNTFEYAVSAAASISDYYINQGRSVGYASAGKYHNLVPAERGERQLGKILETLAFVKPEGNLPILGVIEAQGKHITRGSTVVLITALNTETIVLSVDVLIRRDLRPIVVFIDPLSFGSATGVDHLATQIRQYGVPVAVVHKGDHLQAALEADYAGLPWDIRVR
jgi:uncharacterized protein (DUF58 family)